MTTSESINEIATALAKAQAAMKPAVKDATNPAFRSKYADLAAVWEACRKPLTDNGITTLQDVQTMDDGIGVLTRLIHSSGQWIEVGPLVVPLGKRDAHGVGSATSYAKRYALSAAVGIVAEDDDDGNAASSHGTGAASSSKPSAVPAKPKGYDEWRDALTAAADNGTAALKETWQGTKDRPVMPSFRNYFNATEKEGTLDALKAKAAQAEAVPA
jgi:hypothetical protein